MTPTARTLAECRRRGWLADVVERWIAISGHPGGGVRRDLFGFIDIVAICHGELIGIQATSGDNVAARVTKILTECQDAANAWRSVGGTIEVWGWRKYKKAVDRKFWRPNIVIVE